MIRNRATKAAAGAATTKWPKLPAPLLLGGEGGEGLTSTLCLLLIFLIPAMGSGDSPAQFFQRNRAARHVRCKFLRPSHQASIPYMPHSEVVLCTRGSGDSWDFLPLLELSCWRSPEDPCRAHSRLEMNVCRAVTSSLSAFGMMAAG